MSADVNPVVLVSQFCFKVNPVIVRIVGGLVPLFPLKYTSTRAFALAGRKEQKIEEDNWSRNVGDLHKV